MTADPDPVSVEYHVAFTTPGHQSDGIITLAKRPGDTTRLTAGDLAKARDLIAQRTHFRPDQVVIINVIRLDG